MQLIMIHPQTYIPRLWGVRSMLSVAALLLTASTGMAGTWLRCRIPRPVASGAVTMIKKLLSSRQPALAVMFLLAAILLTPVPARSVGSWTPLKSPTPNNDPVQLMLLLPDGTVMAAGSNITNTWYKLTPDTNGSYVNGTWSKLKPMSNLRLYYSSAVLRDGRVFVAGGEYGNGAATTEIYNPLNDTWTTLSVPTNVLDSTQPSSTGGGNQAFVDSGSILLPDGRVMIAPVNPKNSFDTVIYDPVSNTWSSGPTARPGNQNESSWVKLPDESILTIDANSTTSRRYLPIGYLTNHVPAIASNRWIIDANVSQSVFGSIGGEIGPGMLLADGTAFFVGANGKSCIYTPTGDNTFGSWQIGPALPNVTQYPIDDNGNELKGAAFVTTGAAPDAPAASMVNGQVLYAFSGQLYNDPRSGNPPADATNNYWLNRNNPIYPTPATLFVYDPPTKTFTQIAGPTGATDDIPAYKAAMLTLPDGSVLYAHQGSDLYVYTLDPVHDPNDRINPSSRPTIQSLNRNADGSWHLTGTQLNGLSQGASYGDDLQMDSNYPLVQLIARSGEITYARTMSWSSTGVQTGNKIVSTDFVLPSTIVGTGTVSVVVVANGIASDPMALPFVRPGQTLTFSGNSSMGSSDYEISGGPTTFQDDGSASGILLRGDGGLIKLLDSATGGTATIFVDGGMGNGGHPGYLAFYDNSTAGAADILNHAGVLGPNFKNLSPSSVDGFGGTTIFFDAAKAGTARVTNEGEANGNSTIATTGGITDFRGISSADHGTFVTLGATAVNGKGGLVQFAEGATADHGIFTNFNSNDNNSPLSQGRTVFFENATAGQGMFINVGGDGGFLEFGATTEFRGGSSAGNGTFINQGGTGGTYPGRGATQFFETASAGTGMFLNKPAPGGGGGTEFYGHSIAANGTFVNDSTVTGSGDSGGEILFKEDSAAGHGSFQTTGVAGGFITFRDRTSADHGTFVIDPNLENSRVVFSGSSTAGNGSFDIGGYAYLQFSESSSAGNATIVLRGNGTAGGNPVTGGSRGSFANGSTAGNARITVMGAEQNGGIGGNLAFEVPATAGNATITVNGASVTTFGAYAGSASFGSGTTAGTATLIINGGTNGGDGGALRFGGDATADQARIILNAGGTLDVAGSVFYGGTPAGSIEGAGHISLGQSLLTVGSLNTSTVFSGVISDDSNPNVGYLANGRLTKVGTGTLTLSGTNTYSGVTTVNAGILVVNGWVAGNVQVNGGATLKGSNNIGGSVNVAPGGKVAPGNSPGTLTISGDYSQGPESFLEIEIAGPNPENRDHLIVNGNVNLSGTLLLVFSGYAPSAAETFPVLEVGGNFNEDNLKVVILGLKPGFQTTHQFTGGKLTLTATSSGQLRTIEDPIQALKVSVTPQAGFIYPVFTLLGATYRFDTSVDLKTWTSILEVPGANALVEFRHIPPAADFYRFYRLIQASGSP